MNDLLVDILAFWIFIGGFIGGFVQILFALSNDDELSFKTAFWYAMVFYENNEDRLNSAGLTIVIAAMSLLLLPGYVLIFFITCLYRTFCKLWEAYKHVFRKNRSNNADGERKCETEIIRCKDCKCYVTEDQSCKYHGMYLSLKPDNYCSHGERR